MRSSSHPSLLFLVLLLFSLCLLPSLSECKEKGAEVPLIGGGGGAQRQLFLDWSYSYRVSYANLQLNYFRNSSLSASLPALNNNTVDFVQSDLALSKEQKEQYPNIRQYPFMVVPIVAHYNIPELPVFIANEEERLILSVELLAEIYLGAIKNWRDPKILAANPKLAHLLPNKNITSVAFSGAATSNLFCTQSFYHESKLYRSIYDSPVQAWPSNITNYNPSLITRPGSFGTISGVQATPYSIGYVTLATWQLGNGGTTPYVALKSKNETLLPAKEDSLRLLDEAKINRETGEMILGDADDLYEGWPILGVTYLLVNSNPPTTKENQCENRQEFARFIRWTLVNQDAEDQASTKGFYLLRSQFQETVLEMLEGLTCDGQELLAIQIIDNHDSSAFEALLALSMALAGVTLIPGFVFFVFFSRDSNDQKVQIVAKLYSSLLLIGGLIVYLSIVWFYLLPEETWVCQLRQWFAGFGFSVFLGALFTRTLQIHRIYRISKSKRLPTRRTGTDLRKRGIFDFVYGLGLVMTGQLVILIVWSTVDTLEARLSVINDIERTASWVCKSDNVWLWIGLEIGFFICLLCYGILVVYRTWDLKSRFTEAKWLLMAIYNLLLTLAALVPLFATIEIDDENLFYIAVAGLNFVLASTLLALYIQRGAPWLEKWIWRWRTSSTRSDKVSGGGTGGGSTTSMSFASRATGQTDGASNQSSNSS